MKQTIANILIELLERHFYKDISVRIICESVPISRSSFYNYFKNKDEIVKWFITQDYMANAFPIFKFHLKEKGVQTFFDYLKRNKNFYKKIYEYDDGNFLRECFMEAYFHSFSFIKDISLNVDKKKGHINPDIFITYFSGGMSCVIAQWIKNDMDISEEDMAKDTYLMMEQPMGIVRDYYL